jgi:hypothetical protein
LAEQLQPVGVLSSAEPHGSGDVVVIECRLQEQVGKIVGRAGRPGAAR